ncbi:amidohydrolase family protein [Companilactobacillus mishanensis]|uniref:amidohydrolase family protein n=1 Tax=Companilactobacillus mishanensis TaxID=2486008 RepID=UPI001295110B|nr:amidohydrolase family protein [Companilactobacillus mishanensis]MQS89653.1 amidohydrolase [Companilactobacillus mishanensis]
MTKIDAFAHILTPKFLSKMEAIDPTVLNKFPFMKNEFLTDLDKHLESIPEDVQQILSFVNLNPEDFTDPKTSAELCRAANEELLETVNGHKDEFPAGVAMVPMNNIDEAINIIDDQVANKDGLAGIQLFTRAMGKTIADPSYHRVFEKMVEIDKPIWLHPVFDQRKPDNNIAFSWEYELTQAMNDIVTSGLYQEFPNMKVIVHHAGAMVPFFSQRIKYIMTKENYADFQKFYVDTAILGNTKALELAFSFFKADHVVLGTDSPFGIPPAGATEVIIEAIEKMDITGKQRNKIYKDNITKLAGQ